MSDAPSIKITPHQLSDLVHQATLLRLFHHRNNLQHRRSTWYRIFKILRRHLTRLIAHHTTLHKSTDSHTARLRKKATDREIQINLQAEIALWTEVIAPRAYAAFTQPTADNRFAPLGVFLLAALAEICMILGVTERIEQAVQDDTITVLERFGKEHWVQEESMISFAGVTNDDIGVLVTRKDDVMDSRIINADSADLATPDSSVKTIVPAKRKPSKVRSKHHKKPKSESNNDAIDDLFSGL